MSSINLSKEKGLNPRLTYCTRCGGDAGEIVLLGDREYKIKCSNCDCWNFGAKFSDTCGKCKQTLRGGSRERIEDDEKLPSSNLCDECVKEIQKYKNIVTEGGVYFRCKQCGSEGVIKGESEYAKHAREYAKIFPPDPMGIEMENCSEHGGSNE